MNFFLKSVLNCAFFYLLVLFPCFSHSLPVIPDELNIPKHLNKRTASQIQAVFSSLKKQYDNKTANLWLLKYQEALLLKKKKTEVFCSYMKELSKAPAFPLKQLSLVQSYEICPYPEDLKFHPESFPEWLRFRLAEAFYKRRKFFKNEETTLSAVIYLAKNSPYKDLKVSYLKHALSLAEEQKKTDEQTHLQEILYEEAPRYKLNPKPKDYFLVAEDLRQNRQFQKARSFYVKTLNSPVSGFKEKNRSFKALNRIYKIQKQNKKRLMNFKQWSDWLLKENTEQSLEMYYKRKLELARQEWNQDQNQKAIQMINTLLQEPKSEVIKEKALYLRGLIYTQEKKPELSLQDFDQLVKNLRKTKRHRNLLEKVLWKRALLFRNQSNYKQALYDFKALEKISQNPYTQYKALFWKAKSLWDLGQKALAKKFLRQLIKKDHFGYYGLLARKILNKKPVFQKKEKALDLTFLSENSSSESLVHWLILFKEFELLSRFLDTQEDAFLKVGKQTEQSWLKIISLWIKAKKYLEVFQSLEKMDEDIRKSFSEKYSYLLFPLDFSEEVEKVSKKWDIPKAFIFALIRQESAFNVRARSTADAFGLMQLIPSTARRTARKFKVPYRNFRDLYKPSKNILLGTAYLKSLLKRYNNSLVLSVAAYNAGETPVDRWNKERKDMETLDFIENIPYEETRSYVRLIIRNYLFYNSLMEAEGPWFPEWLLQR